MSCKHTVEQITELREGALPFWKAWSLRFHLRMCPYCAEYERQLRATTGSLKAIDPEPPPRRVRDHLLDEFKKRGD